MEILILERIQIQAETRLAEHDRTCRSCSCCSDCKEDRERGKELRASAEGKGER
jgi:hypothetical protein